MNLDSAKISYSIHIKYNCIIIKDRINKLSFIKIKHSAHQKIPLIELKDTHRLGEDICNTF